MPPLVMTHRARRRASSTASTIASTSSGTTCTERSGTPRSRSRRINQAPLASTTLAVSTSLPMITAATPWGSIAGEAYASLSARMWASAARVTLSTGLEPSSSTILSPAPMRRAIALRYVRAIFFWAALDS